METIKKTWRGGLVGKLIIGCGGLIILSCLCAVPLTILGNLGSSSDATTTPASNLAEVATESPAATATNTPLPTFTPGPTVQPTNTPLPTLKPEPTATPVPTLAPTLEPTATPEPTPQPNDALGDVDLLLYGTEVGGKTMALAEALSNFGDLMQLVGTDLGLLADEEWQADVELQICIVRRAHVSLLEMDVPA